MSLLSFLETKFRFYYKALEKFSRIPKKVRFFLLPFIWPGIAAILNVISRNSRKVVPYDTEHTKVIFLRSEVLSTKIVGMDLTSALLSWIQDSLGLRISAEINSSQDLKYDYKNSILVIDYEWIFTIHEKPFMFLKIVRLGIKSRRLGMPVWIFLGDTFAVRYLPATCFLVALCGGSIILQPNTAQEGEAFGLVFPVGPYLWTMSERNTKAFFSSVEIVDRPKVALLARTGEMRRIEFMKNLEKRFDENGWGVIGSDGKLSWDEYVSQVKNVRVLVTTNWMHKIHVRGTKRTRERISKTTTTHRVWEGFASGAMVMTQRTSVLDFFGFVPGKHYFELWSEDDLNKSLVLPCDEEINQIANSGQELFLTLVKAV